MTDLVRRESEFLLYTAPDGAVKVGVLFRDETAWLTQKALAELFAVKVPAINKHLKNIFESGELSEDSVVSILETTAKDKKTYKIKHFNLDAVLSVGYRINSKICYFLGFLSPVSFNSASISSIVGKLVLSVFGSAFDN